MIKNGIDRIELWKPLLSGKKVGVMTHAPAVACDWQRSVDLLARHLNVTSLWGPEHGLDGVAQAGVSVDSAVDDRTGLPVFSLYGKTKVSFPDTLKDVDAVVCDFCDIGSRFYTYISTMADAMSDCAAAGIPFFVLDRPDPIGGIRCDGTILEPKFSSFVGRYPIPVRHGLTIGEAAGVFNEMFSIHCDLTVIPVSGWTRDMEFEDTGQCWINPSPNMPGPDCARIYTGTCFLEGTNISEGRGTTRPYEIIGAPFIDGDRIAGILNGYRIPGIAVRSCRFSPSFSKYANEICGGIQILLTDRKNANCFEFGIRLLDVLRSEYGQFDYGDKAPFFDKLMGTDQFRLMKVSADEMIELGEEESRIFHDRVKEYMLY